MVKESWIKKSINLYLTDVFLPVAGNGTVDLFGAVLAGGFPQARPTVPRLRNTFPVLGVSGALQACLVMFVMSCTDRQHTKLLQFTTQTFNINPSIPTVGNLLVFTVGNCYCNYF